MSLQQPDPPERLQSDSLTAQILYSEVWRNANVDNEHFVLCVVGREGSGKSGTALSLADALDDGFHADRVCFEPAQMLRLIKSNQTERGSALVLDEAGVGMGARSWYDKDQIKLNKTLQTIRDDNQILILTLPALGELDSMTVNRLHAYAEMTTLEEGEYADFRFKFLHPQRGPSGNLYEEYPRRKIDGRRCKVSRLRVSPPPADLWENYQEKKEAFKSELYDDTIEELEDDGEEEKPEPRDIADEIIAGEGADTYIRSINSGTQRVLDADLIGGEYDLSVRDAKRVKKMLLSEVDKEVI